MRNTTKNSATVLLAMGLLSMALVSGLGAVVLPTPIPSTTINEASKAAHARNDDQEETDAAPLADLVVHLLTQQQNTGTGNSGSTIRVLPARLPDSLPASLPMPIGGRLLGSVEQTSEKGGRRLDIVLDAPSPPETVQTFFDQAMAQQGWNPPPPGTYADIQALRGPAGAANQTGGTVARPHTYCHELDGPSVTLTVYPQGAAPSDVRIKVVMPAPGRGGLLSDCSRLASSPRSPSPAASDSGNQVTARDLLPHLTAPVGTEVVEQNPFMDRWSYVRSYGITNRLRTDLSPVVLESEIASQLAAVGWARTDGEAADLLA
jgi:hypothetical protein